MIVIIYFNICSDFIIKINGFDNYIYESKSLVKYQKISTTFENSIKCAAFH